MGVRIRIFWQKGVTDEQIIFVQKCIEEFLRFVPAGRLVRVEVGKEIKVARYKEHRFSRKISINKMEDNGLYWEESNDYNSFIIFRSPLLKVIDRVKIDAEGFADLLKYAAVSFGCLKGLHQDYREMKLRWVIFHELGHLFGLISPARRAELVKITHGSWRHCANENCVMYPYSNNFYVGNFTMPFCAVCFFELRDSLHFQTYFSSR